MSQYAQFGVGASIPVATLSALTSVASATGSTQLLAANPLRKGFVVYNDSTAILYLALSSAASSTSYTVQMPTLTSYSIPFNGAIYTGPIFGAWASANGNARITELT